MWGGGGGGRRNPLSEILDPLLFVFDEHTCYEIVDVFLL